MASIKKRADAMRDRGAAYFEAWEKQLAAMSTPGVALSTSPVTTNRPRSCTPSIVNRAGWSRGCADGCFRCPGSTASRATSK